MILKRLKLKNFRGYKFLEVDFDKNMNVIIGKNDIGKSTIMEALDIFFNNNTKTKIDIDDLNIHSEEPIIEISCLFEDDDTNLIIDSTYSTTLRKEFLLNNEGLLEIKKSWNCSKSKINASDLKIYLKANYPQIGKLPLINIKRGELQKLLDKLKDEIDHYDDINKNINSEIRTSLYNYHITNNCDFKEVFIDINKEDAKNIWTKISNNLPIFFLFKSDRSNIDSDSEVQDPLKLATKNVLKEISDELDKIKDKVEEAVKIIGNNTIEKLKELDSDIALNLNTELSLKPWDSIFSFEVIDGRGIPLNKRGSGIRRLMLLSYFRAEAERVIKESSKNNVIYAIEEPETSQHPNYQTMIMEALLDLSTDYKHQIIITTHTPEIAKMVDINKIIFLNKDSFGNSKIVQENDNKIKEVIKSLGILPDVYTKLVVFVEGPTDVLFIEHLSRLDSFRKIIDINKENISIIPLTGGNLKKWVTKNYFDNSPVKEIHIYDSDVDDYKKLVSEMNKEPGSRRFGIITERREIENYIPPTLIEEHLDIYIENSIKENWSNEDIPKLIMSKFGQKRNMQEKDIKSILNGKIAKNITEEDLKSIGAFTEISNWFNKISSMYNTTISLDEVALSTE